jgi:hypothetical protein
MLQEATDMLLFERQEGAPQHAGQYQNAQRLALHVLRQNSCYITTASWFM